ncbi:hypothetical protein [uncultured Piscinibacter sp.]|uniref:hypothetical protein n=1 Tax=uncultured Piscinibacter sp. TaxID=1131835 RepID=UPI00260C280A|nr:hypothetical protein [uncultured Piscinibacter sp.]
MLTVGFAVLGVLGFLATLFALWVLQNRRNFKAMVASAETAVRTVYVGAKILPTLTARYVYSFPAFQLGFASKADFLNAAESGANDRFVREIQVLCQSKGTQERPFDAKLAVTFEYPGCAQERLEASAPLVQKKQ